MPNKCCVPGCTGNYLNGPKVHVFRFPSDPNLHKKWLRAIPRENYVPTKYSRVCELHFVSDDLVWNISQQDSNTGKIVSIKLDAPRLKINCVPSKFPNCPQYLSKNITFRKSKDEKLKELDEVRFLQAIEDSKREFDQHKKLTQFQNFEEFNTVFVSFSVAEGWFVIKNPTNVTIFKIEYTPGPLITWSVVISDDLQVNTYLYGQPLSIKVNKLKTPFLTSSLDEITNLLDTINSSVIEVPVNTENDNTGCPNNNVKKFEPVFKFIINILDNSFETLKMDDESFAQGLNFVSEQLKLRTSSKERYRYSTETLIFCSIFYTISPHAYKYLRSHAPIILPHPETIKSICNNYLTDPHIDEKSIFLTYARNIFKFLKEQEKHVILLMDEIHIDPYLDYKGGNIVGASVKFEL